MKRMCICIYTFIYILHLLPKNNGGRITEFSLRGCGPNCFRGNNELKQKLIRNTVLGPLPSKELRMIWEEIIEAGRDGPEFIRTCKISSVFVLCSKTILLRFLFIILMSGSHSSLILEQYHSCSERYIEMKETCLFLRNKFTY